MAAKDIRVEKVKKPAKPYTDGEYIRDWLIIVGRDETDTDRLFKEYSQSLRLIRKKKPKQDCVAVRKDAH